MIRIWKEARAGKKGSIVMGNGYGCRRLAKEIKVTGEMRVKHGTGVEKGNNLENHCGLGWSLESINIGWMVLVGEGLGR